MYRHEHEKVSLACRKIVTVSRTLLQFKRTGDSRKMRTLRCLLPATHSSDLLLSTMSYGMGISLWSVGSALLAVPS